MMNKIVIGILFLIFGFGKYAIAQTPMEILAEMYAHTSTLAGLTADIKKVERIDDEYITQISAVKININPYRVYIKQLSPKSGVEVMAFKNNAQKKAAVNLNSFPWITLYLDPYGGLMRHNQHHLVYDSGFDLMVKILKHELGQNVSDSRLKKMADTTWNDSPVYKLKISNPDYKIISYTVKAHENIDRIASKLFVNSYTLMELNPKISNHNDVEEGDVIYVPTHYASQMILFIDKRTFLPVVIRVYDLNGLYEKYEYNHLVINPIFDADTFSEDNPEYGF